MTGSPVSPGVPPDARRGAEPGDAAGGDSGADMRCALAPLDARSRMLTVLTLIGASCVVVGAGVLAATSTPAVVPLVLAPAGAVVAVLGVAACSAPVAIRFAPAELQICRRGGTRTRYPVRPDADLAPFVLDTLVPRPGRLSGFCGTFGRFRCRDGGAVEVAVTDRDRTLRIDGVGVRPLVVSPADPAAFAAALVAAAGSVPADG